MKYLLIFGILVNKSVIYFCDIAILQEYIYMCVA